MPLTTTFPRRKRIQSLSVHRASQKRLKPYAALAPASRLKVSSRVFGPKVPSKSKHATKKKTVLPRRKIDVRPITVSEEALYRISLDAAIYPEKVLTFKRFREILADLPADVFSLPKSETTPYLVFSIRDGSKDLITALRDCYETLFEDTEDRLLTSIKIAYDVVPDFVKKRLDSILGKPSVCDASFDRIVSEFDKSSST